MIDPKNLHRIGIGGSEVAALFDADEFTDAFTVWARKKGGLERKPDQQPDIRQTVGKCLEKGVLDLYTHATGRELEYCDVTSQHPERPYQIYTPDAICTKERIGVDAKVVFYDQRRKWGLEADEIPMRVTLQCFWYMSALNFDRWDVCALVGGEPRIYTIERDLEAERVMLERVEEWYLRYIVGNDRPPIGNSEEASRWLQQAYPVHKHPDLREATLEEIQTLNQYVQLRLAQKALGERRSLLEAQIKEAIADREGLQWEEGIFTWRKSKDGKVVDYKSMAIGLLYHFLKDPEARDKVLAEYTKPKAGTRRIRIDHDAMRGAVEQDEAA